MKYKNLNAELARKGMSKEDLTKAVNEAGYEVGYSTVCRQLRGEQMIPFQQAGVIAKVLDADVNYLFDEGE